MIKDVKLGHVKVSTRDLEIMVEEIACGIATGEQRVCIPLNLTKYVMSKHDHVLAGALMGADLVIADGVPIVWLARRLGYHDVHRVTGIDLAERLLSLARAKGWRLFFLGARSENLEKAVQQVRVRFNEPAIVGVRDGYFNESELPQIIAEINSARPDILLLGLGLPQKEYFVADHLGELDVRFCITVGGAFDIWAGTKRRTPLAIQKLGLEWLYRSAYDLSRAGQIVRYGLHFLRDLALPPTGR